MTDKEKLTRLIIEAIHGLPYDECEEQYNPQHAAVTHPADIPKYIDHPITIGRVMQALINKHEILVCTIKFELFYSFEKFLRIFWDGGIYFLDWKLAKENGQEMELSDQSDETIESLLKLFS